MSPKQSKNVCIALAILSATFITNLYERPVLAGPSKEGYSSYQLAELESTKVNLSRDTIDGAPGGAKTETTTQTTKESSSSSQTVLSTSELTAKIVELIKQSRYSDAVPFAKQLVDSCEKQYGSNHANTATVLHNLGFLYQQLGEYDKAEPIFSQALAIREKSLGPNDPDVALSLNNLALLYEDEGDYDRSEALYLRAIEIKEKNYGAENVEVGVEVNNLATLYRDKGNNSKAETLFNRVLSIFEKFYGSDDVRVATVLNNLAGLYRENNDFAHADELYKRVMEIDKKKLPADHLDQARDMNNLGVLYYEEGKFNEAQQLLLQALKIRKDSLGDLHPDLIPLLSNLALLNVAQGDMANAIKYQKNANEVSEHCLTQILQMGSENQKRLYLASISEEIDASVSMNIKYAATNNEATRLALGTLFRRKGRLLDVVSHELFSLRKHLSEADRKLFDQLSANRAELADLVLHGSQRMSKDAYLSKISSLYNRAEEIETELSQHSAQFRIQNQPATIELVQHAIPSNAKLLEYTRFRLLDGKAMTSKQRYGPDHYAAYVLGPTGEATVSDLGEAVKIDNAVEQLRTALRNRESLDFKVKSRELYELVIDPLKLALGNSPMVLLSPDSALNFIPFAALIDEHGKYLIENYSLDYLTSGRDLLRFNEQEPSKSGPVIVANPQFNMTIPAANKEASDRTQPNVDAAVPSEPSDRSLGYSFPIFAPLLGTAYEAKSIAQIVPHATILTGQGATEAAVKKLVAPEILHFATHGFFLPEDSHEARSKTEADRTVQIIPASGKNLANQQLEDPLLRSAIALAGANNKRNSDGQDGILTALEFSGLDLWGTKLVVLSACDTGAGTVKAGGGVYGLRRAVLIAGARSEVISLWPVSDEATAFLMIEFYKRLLSGEGRMEALRQAQLKLLRISAVSHPNYWAAFIPVGDWRKL